MPRTSDAEYLVSDRLLSDIVLRNSRTITGSGDRDLVSYYAFRVGTHSYALQPCPPLFRDLQSRCDWWGDVL